MRKRCAGINLRVTPEEKRRMAAAARRCGLSLSEYLRQRAVGYEPRWHPPGRLFEALAVLEEAEPGRVPTLTSRSRMAPVSGWMVYSP